jgi:hypothetical protein
VVVGFNAVSFGQVRINEVCSSNSSLIEDEDGDTNDWIELFNPTSEPINLTGYFLSDRLSNPLKWQFQAGIIPANGFLTVFASGKDRAFGLEFHTSFKLSQNGETICLHSPAILFLDSMLVPLVPTDYSFGSYPDGASDRSFFQLPTPSGSNNSSVPAERVIASLPTFSLGTGLYQQELVVEITSTITNDSIFYTLDGSEPNRNSTLYSGPIPISETTVLTAKAFANELLPSQVVVANYLFIEQQHLPIVCLSTHPSYFFDADTGIYVLGPNASSVFPFYGANFWSETEVPVHVQWIDERGYLGFGQQMGVQIHGGSVSRTRPMRSLRLLADGNYGKDEINYPLFPNKVQPETKRFLLRNSGSDFLKTMFRDGFIQNLFIEEQLHVDAVSYQPVEVYLNAQFHGLHNVREKVDRYYLHYNHGVDVNMLDLLEEQNLIMDGNFDAFNAMEAQLLSMDLTDDVQFEQTESMFDVLNLADYYICQTFLNNLDWPYNNLKFWRERKPDAKWRYIIFDLDATHGGVSFNPVDIDNLERILGSFGDDNRHVVIFRKLLENHGYRNFFINRYCDLVNTTFSPSSVVAASTRAAARIEPVIHRHFERWGAEEDTWNDEVEKVNAYATERPPYAINYLQEFFDLAPQATVHLNVYPPLAGSIALNSVSIRKFPFNGVYFEDVPIRVDVAENSGFTFSHWESNRPDLATKGSGIGFLPTNGDSLTAIFTGYAKHQPLSIYPNPTFGYATVRFELDQKQTIALVLQDLNGRTITQLYAGELLAGTHEMQVDLPKDLSGLYVITLKTEHCQESGKVAILKSE